LDSICLMYVDEVASLKKQVQLAAEFLYF